MPFDIETMLKSLPPEAEPALRMAGFMEPDRLEVGATVPQLVLRALDEGAEVEIGGVSDRPIVLIFGSYT